ncbi:MAG: hypothetical protein C6I01_00935, partial [Epsilonproteobacteria bacterium]|nr:hypothetical protein [Campylobacterota bacterium]NPA89363.1 hypothetical protein [Campylobacterota bacterium]
QEQKYLIHYLQSNPTKGVKEFFQWLNILYGRYFEVYPILRKYTRQIEKKEVHRQKDREIEGCKRKLNSKLSKFKLKSYKFKLKVNLILQFSSYLKEKKGKIPGESYSWVSGLEVCCRF